MANQLFKYALKTVNNKLIIKQSFRRLSSNVTTNVSELQNGVRVVTRRSPHSSTACLALYIDCGSRDESQDQNGVINVWQRLKLRDKQLIKDVYSMGARMDAFTD
jgi:predicted Zn-dependent peptidase